MTSRSTPRHDRLSPGSVGPRVAVALLHLAIVLTGVVVIASALARDRTDEVAGGVALVVLGLGLGIAGIARPASQLTLLTAIGAVVQVGALLWYYFNGFARDANAYHQAALTIIDPDQELVGRFAFEASAWSNFVVSRFTAGIYEVLVPSQLLAFVIFASVGLLAKVLFARAMLRSRPVLGRAAPAAALGVMVFPSLALWLSPIGKETFAVLGVALVVLGVARPVSERPRMWLIALGILTAAATRPHVAMLLGVGVLAHAAVSAAIVTQSLGRRVAILCVATGLVVASVNATASFFDIEASLAGFGEVRDDLAAIEGQGDADITARPIDGVNDIPAATANVLLRPFIFEASRSSSLVQALETTLLLVLVIWVLFQGGRRRRNRVTGAARQHVRSLRAFAVTYLVVFVYAFSGMYNLGLMSRQRSQVTLIFLLLIAMSLTTTRKARRQTLSPLQPTGADAPAPADETDVRSHQDVLIRADPAPPDTRGP